MVTQVGAPLTALEFAALCEFCGRDRLPFPLTFTSDVPLLADFEQQKKQAAQRLLRRGETDDRFDWAVRTLLDPVVRVEMVGVDRVTGTAIRAHAGIDRRAGAVAVQQPGPTPETGGDIVLSLLRAPNVARHLVEVLPSVRPGRTGGMSVRRSDVERPGTYSDAGGSTSWQVRLGRSAPRDPGEQARAFLIRPIDRMVELTVDTGPAHDGRRDSPSTLITIVDYTDDGRYLVRRDQHTALVVPATDEAVVAELDRHIGPRLERAAVP